ncbi:MAG: DNA topoisomerase [Chitinophagales bacterium]
MSAAFTVGDITVKPAKRSPAAPFTTSTLQQEASNKLGFSVSRTMVIAQKLYEEGHITYMRTDSVNLSDLAMAAIKAEIIQQYRDKYAQRVLLKQNLLECPGSTRSNTAYLHGEP